MPPGFSGIAATFLKVMSAFALGGLAIAAFAAALAVGQTRDRRYWGPLPATVAVALFLGYALGNFFRWF